MDYYQDLLQEPKWYRWADGFVVLLIGIALGMTVMLALPAYETEMRGVNTTRETRLLTPDAPAQDRILTENGSSIRIDEI